MRDNGFGSFGYYLLGIVYLCISLSSIVGPAVLKRIGLKRCLILGGYGHFIFILLQVLPAWRDEYVDHDADERQNLLEKVLTNETFNIVIMIIGAILNGFGATMLWVAQGEYISKCSNEDSKGFFFGYFWSIH